MHDSWKSFNNLNNQTPQKRWGLIFIFLGFALAILITPLSFPTPESVDRLIHIDANSFQFSPGEIKVNPGDRVTIELVSTDVVHGISIDGYNFTLVSDPGQVAKGSFIASKSGMFRFRCSVACGNLHPFMIGKLQVGSNLLMIRGILLALLAIIAAGFTLKQSDLQNKSFGNEIT
jgi:heme/copper-type cytochrome/quinol oxidase subunit 2